MNLEASSSLPVIHEGQVSDLAPSEVAEKQAFLQVPSSSDLLGLATSSNESLHSSAASTVGTLAASRRHGSARALKYKQSQMSKISIGVFLNNFPETDTAYVNDGVMNAVSEMISADVGVHKDMSRVDKLRKWLRSHRLNLLLMLLVVVDCLSIVVHVVIDVVHHDFHSRTMHHIEEAAEVVGLAVLCVFVLVICANVVLLPRIFFASKLEVTDALLVIVAFIAEILSLAQHDKVKTIEALVVIFRFWRVIRIVTTIVITIEKRVYEKLDKLKNDIQNIMEENDDLEKEVATKQHEIDALKAQLLQLSKFKVPVAVANAVFASSKNKGGFSVVNEKATTGAVAPAETTKATSAEATLPDVAATTVPTNTVIPIATPSTSTTYDVSQLKTS